jgi:hypothetical protein
MEQVSGTSTSLLDDVEARLDAAAAEVLVAFEMWRSESVPSQRVRQ